MNKKCDDCGREFLQGETIYNLYSSGDCDGNGYVCGDCIESYIRRKMQDMKMMASIMNVDYKEFQK